MIRKSNTSAAGNIFSCQFPDRRSLNIHIWLKMVYTNHADKAKVSNTEDKQ